MIEAISNLVKNALDHTQRENDIYINWKQFASIIQVIITDNGSGIHPEDLPHIFKRFYRNIHGIYEDEEVIISLEGEVLEGSISRKKQKLLEAWMVIHSEELDANWKLLSDGEPFFKIEPLR